MAAENAERIQREQDLAAAKLQAVHRGRQVRSAPASGAAVASESVAEAEAEEDEAALAAIDGEEENAAATKMQAVHRGRAARKGA